MRSSGNPAHLGGAALLCARQSDPVKHSSLPIFILLLVVCISSIGCIGITSASKTGASTAPSDPTPPTSPASHFVTLTWSPSASDVAAYNVYRSKSAAGPFSRTATIVAAKTQYVDDHVKAGETYYYVVTSVSSEGMESTDSTLAIATVPDSGGHSD
jgi:hypothetical protein